jgi:ABC-type transport system involved in multi-copper enzyme maturation permease subunit
MNPARPALNLPSALFVVRCLVRDTVRQSLDSKAFWLLLGFSGLCVLLCLGVRVEGATAHRPPGEIELYGANNQPFTGVNAGQGHLSLAFGAIRLRLPRDGESAVIFLQTLLARWGASAVGMLLILLWTSGFLPDFLQPRSASVLLAKPVPRWSLLAGKYLGVLAFVTLHVIFFVLGTWLALGWKTGFWHPAYLLSIPLLVVEFAILYSFSALLAVWTRSTVVCIFGALVFWCLCSTVTFSRHAVVAQRLEGTQASAPSAVPEAALQAAYWVLPKPADLNLVLDEVLDGGKHFQGPPELRAVQKNRAFEPVLSLLTSLLFTAAVLAVAGRRFGSLEY